MTKLSDITSDFTRGLSQITSFVPDAISNFQNADSKLRGQEDDLVNGYDVPFAGMGATTFSNATENNIQLSGRVQQKIQEFVTASGNTNQQVGSINDHYEGQIDNYVPPVTIGIDDPLAYFNYSYQQVAGMLRDGTLGPYGNIGDVLSMGLPHLLGNLLDASNSVKSTIKSRSQQIEDNITQQYNAHLKQTGITDPTDIKNSDKSNPNIVTAQEKEIAALGEVDQIYNNHHDAFSGWYQELTGLISDYKQTMTWTTATGNVTVGDLLQDMKNAPAPITIYRTSDGNLVVLVNDMNNGKNAQQNAALVQQAIAQYDLLNNLKNPKVTILGYKGGADTVENLANLHNSPFTITNAYLVGAQATANPNTGVNYVSYINGSSSDSSKNATLAVDAGEIAIGAATMPEAPEIGGGIALGEIVAGSAISAATTPKSGGISGNVPFGTVKGTGFPIDVPVEPGMQGSSDNYMQSSFLDVQGVTTPTQNPGVNNYYKNLIHGVEPLSAPTYYYDPSSLQSPGPLPSPTPQSPPATPQSPPAAPQSPPKLPSPAP